MTNRDAKTAQVCAHKGNVFVSDMLGKKIHQQALVNQTTTRFNLNVNRGNYIVRVVTDQEVYTGKVYLN